MKRLALAVTCAVWTVSTVSAAFAQSPAPSSPPAQAPAAPDCAAQAVDRKLAGAALNSFMKKCEHDAALRACDAAATEKKLSGAARASFTRKCARDATLAPAGQ